MVVSHHDRGNKGGEFLLQLDEIWLVDRRYTRFHNVGGYVFADSGRRAWRYRHYARGYILLLLSSHGPRRTSLCDCEIRDDRPEYPQHHTAASGVSPAYSMCAEH